MVSVAVVCPVHSLLSLAAGDCSESLDLRRERETYFLDVFCSKKEESELSLRCVSVVSESKGRGMP